MIHTRVQITVQEVVRFLIQKRFSSIKKCKKRYSQSGCAENDTDWKNDTLIIVVHKMIQTYTVLVIWDRCKK